MATFERAAVVGAPVADFWDRVISSEGINDEMLPWMTMRLPRSAHGLTVDTLPIGKVLGRAWILLFGAIPVEFDRLAMVDVGPGHHFHEKSTMLSMRRWEHQRSLDQIDGSTTRITDRVTFEPRLWLMAPMMAKMLHALSGTAIDASSATSDTESIVIGWRKGVAIGRSWARPRDSRRMRMFASIRSPAQLSVKDGSPSRLSTSGHWWTWVAGIPPTQINTG